jgi:hypothetical protein
MGNYCTLSREKKKLACIECDSVLADEPICDVCLRAEMRYLDNLKYIHQYGQKNKS